MTDRKFIGSKSEPLVVDVEKGQLRFFAKATGETNPIYVDEQAAAKAGYSALPAPPTFGFTLGLAKPDPFARYVKMGIDLGKVLHGEQAFEYAGAIQAGDTITLVEELVDIFEKKGGALEFLAFQTTGINQHGTQVLKMVTTTVVRNG